MLRNERVRSRGGQGGAWLRELRQEKVKSKQKKNILRKKKYVYIKENNNNSNNKKRNKKPGRRTYDWVQ